MKRDPALVSLSHDHHRALFAAQKLRRATPGGARRARRAGLDYWERHGRTHLRLEEEVLLPAYARHGNPRHRLVARVLCDHVALRARFDGLAGGQAASAAQLRALGEELAAHVRLEEGQLFPLIEDALPERDLRELAAALARAEADG